MDDIAPSRELLDQIVYGMENQGERFVLDLDTGDVLPEAPADGHEDRFQALPEWKSADGYNLMSRFVATLRNPIYRERLSSILASGRGVFRQFKDAVGEREDIERLWLRFKQREMRSIASEWINDLREIRGLERLELTEEEDTQPLIESDFVFETGGPEAVAAVDSLDTEAFRANFDAEPREVQELLYALYREGAPKAADPESAVLLAVTPGNETAALLWATHHRRGPSRVSAVRLVYVHPAYRGLGLARALLQEHLSRSLADGCTDVLLELAGHGMGFGDAAEELGFRYDTATLRLDLASWARDEGS